MESIENTQATIKEIDQISREKFDEAFAQINQNFGEVFTRLFHGGQAFLRLTDEENQAESGLDIVASPPGKKLQNVLLLSGGEKALTALALLVGIFQFQPSPFCVLDEVDAALDETNVGRLADLLHSLEPGDAVPARDTLQAHDAGGRPHLWRDHAGAGCVKGDQRQAGGTSAGAAAGDSIIVCRVSWLPKTARTAKTTTQSTIA